ncbi:hypothetical protein TNCT_480501 [Trichonephila clavata]|uniref:Uncharacterized protein n=1 Tax=Trichonephila clavata TaxID=2740835 RepID=A0A8X6HXI4_TRICU|nr:hypothetical protein TNCT_480501 [Trichonephila clavata]
MSPAAKFKILTGICEWFSLEILNALDIEKNGKPELEEFAVPIVKPAVHFKELWVKSSLIHVVEAFVCRDRNENYISTSHFVSFERAVDDLKNPSPVHLNQKKFLDQSDYFTKRFIDIVEEEIEDHLTDGSIENIDLRGRKEKSFTAWISLLNGRGTLEIDESFLRRSYYLTELKVTGLTLVSDNDVKGLQIFCG